MVAFRPLVAAVERVSAGAGAGAAERAGTGAHARAAGAEPGGGAAGLASRQNPVQASSVQGSDDPPRHRFKALRMQIEISHFCTECAPFKARLSFGPRALIISVFAAGLTRPND